MVRACFGGFGAGCLPILIQMPIFAALFATARYTPGISSATFYGINLGKTSFALVIIYWCFISFTKLFKHV